MNKNVKNILSSWQELEKFVVETNSVNKLGHKGYYYDEKALIYYNTGYECYYKIPDWEKVRSEIIEYYDHVKNESDLLEAIYDNLSQYRLFSRG